MLADVGLFSGTSVFGANGVLTGSTALQISIPLFSDGLISARIHEEELKLNQAELQVNQLNLESHAQYEFALSQMSEAKSAVKLSEVGLKIADEELQLAQKKLSAGSGAGLELNNSLVSLASASDVNIEAIFGYELAKLNHFKAIGSFEKYFLLEDSL